MNKKQYFGLLMLLIFCMSFFSIFYSVNLSAPAQITRDLDQNAGESIPKTSSVIQKPLNYTDIFQNTTIVRRSFEGINFTINISAYIGDGANYSLVQISFTNNTAVNYTMADVGNYNYTYTYNPENYAPIGFHNVSFLIYNKTGNNFEQLNNQTTFTNFTIVSNSMVSLNSSEYNRGEFLNADIMVKGDISTWLVYITNGKNGNEDTEELMGTDINQFSREVDDWFVDSDYFYYVRVNVTYSGKQTAEYFRFKVINSLPVIVTTSVIFNPTSVFREETFRLDLNVTDYEDDTNPLNIDVSLIIEDPDGTIVFPYEIIDNLADGTFRRTGIKILSSSPIGTYRATITATDDDGGTDTYVKLLTVKNNLPVIHDFEINGQALNDSISVLYGEDIEFTFNVSDIDNNIAYITVALLNQDNEWYNITRAYTNENMTITIRSIELVYGRWYVYIYVIDSDGAVTGLDTDYSIGPQEIIIVADTLGLILPWLAFIIGIGIGLLVGIGIGLYRAKSKLVITQPTDKKKPTKRMIEKKKLDEKRKKDIIKKPISKGLKCRKCGARLDADAVKCPKCGDKIEKPKCKKCDALLDLDSTKCPKCGDKIKVPFKKTEEEKLPQRKIKRKL